MLSLLGFLSASFAVPSVHTDSSQQCVTESPHRAIIAADSNIQSVVRDKRSNYDGAPAARTPPCSVTCREDNLLSTQFQNAWLFVPLFSCTASLSQAIYLVCACTHFYLSVGLCMYIVCMCVCSSVWVLCFLCVFCVRLILFECFSVYSYRCFLLICWRSYVCVLTYLREFDFFLNCIRNLCTVFNVQYMYSV